MSPLSLDRLPQGTPGMLMQKDGEFSWMMVKYGLEDWQGDPQATQPGELATRSTTTKYPATNNRWATDG